MKRPKVSILIPTYNRAEMLRQCLDSIQSVSADCEIIVTDNASPDNTPEMMAGYTRADPRIRYIRNEQNIGGTRNFNLALSESRGHYICLLGDDDMVLPGNFEKKVAILDAHSEVGLVYSLWLRIDEQARSLGVCMWPGLTNYSYIGGRNEFLDLLPASYIMAQAVLFRRELWERLGGLDEDPKLVAGNDWDMWLRYCYHTQTAFINLPLACVRVHPGSYTESIARSNGQFANGRLAIWRKWLVENENPPVLDDRYWQRMLDAFIPDLRYEFGDDKEKIEYSVRAFQDIRRDSIRKTSARFEMFTKRLPMESTSPGGKQAAPHLDSVETTCDQSIAGRTQAGGGAASALALSKGSEPVSGHIGVPVLWNGAIFDPSGYADEARNFILGLDALGIPVAANAIGRHSQTFVGQLDSETKRRLAKVVARQLQPGFINVVHFPAYAFGRLSQASYNIGRVMFETDGLPSEWVAKCNEMDEIWVPTSFNEQTFRRAGVTTKLFKVPGGIDTNRFRPGQKPLLIRGVRGTVFLSIFEWSYRKGWDVLLRAWAEAFTARDDVCLVMRTYPMNATDLLDIKSEIERRIDNFVRAELGRSPQELAPIIVLGEQVPEVDLPRLFGAASAYVAPSRGEGWGRPQMQAMACGLPVIATRWSGNTEFMTDENSLLLDIDGLVEIGQQAEIPFYRGQRWADPSVGHLVTLLRWVRENRSQSAAIGKRARRDMVEHWQWNNVATSAAERLRAIGADLAAKRQLVSIQNPTPPLAVIWEGSQFVNHSLALVNREMCIQLAQDTGVDLSIIPYEQHEFGVEVDPRFGLITERLNRPITGPADIHIRHHWPPNLNPPQEGKWVIMQPWEFGSIPKAWIECMRDHVDEVWAYTNYVRECYVRSGLPADLVHVVPLGVDARMFCPDSAPMELETKKAFKFLYVGGTIWRKGIDVLLGTYTSTFSANDDVCLVIKDMGGQSFYKGQTAKDLIAQYRAAPNSPEIIYLDRTLGDKELQGLYTACDCLVHPYRGEGFGLPIAEAMASALPVIVTGYGAALDFCDDKTAFLIPAREVRGPEKRVGDLETVDYPWWAEPDLEALKLLLRFVVEHPDEATAKGQLARSRIQSDFTWARAAAAVKDRLEALRVKPIRRFAVPSQESKVCAPVERQPQQSIQVRDRERFIEKWSSRLAGQPQRDATFPQVSKSQSRDARLTAPGRQRAAGGRAKRNHSRGQRTNK